MKKETKIFLGIILVLFSIFLLGIIYAKQDKGDDNIVSALELEDNDAFLGDENAPLTIVEFSDYQCPACRYLWEQTHEDLKKEYIETGKVKLIFRDFPLTSIHPMAQLSAEAAECVREQSGNEMYFEYHDVLFENQNQLSKSNLVIWANEMGYDIESCLDLRRFKQEVESDLDEGLRLGVKGTPSFFINGKLYVGAYSLIDFKNIIEEELKNEGL